MSLTLARLCGEWRLVSENYEARNGKYKARIVIFCILAADYFYRRILRFWLKYEARIAIFRIFAAVDRFFPDFSESGKPLRKIGKPLRKIRKPLQKVEMRQRKRKAVEEIVKPLKKIFSDFSEIGKPLKKIQL